MSRQRSGGRQGAQTSAVGAPESSSTAPASDRKGNCPTAPSKRPYNEASEGTKPLSGLIVTATPIGNLGDITVRAVETLRAVDVIACEDTRVTRRLLQRYDISTKTVTYHEHNADRVRPRLIKKLSCGDAIALVSDAGTPLISDPGYKLVQEAIDAGISVTSLPGPTAMITALTVSGLPTDRFLFAGFLPNRSVARRRVLDTLQSVNASLIFYESPRRLGAVLGEMADILGPRDCAVGRELTKRFEEVIRGPVNELASQFTNAQTPRGEVVIILGPPKLEHITEDALDGAIILALSQNSLRDAVDQVSAQTGASRRDVYRRALSLDLRRQSGEAAKNVD
jgi:16S rRNA (cytidine1402-2'-O)-methyltransferase